MYLLTTLSIHMLMIALTFFTCVFVLLSSNLRLCYVGVFIFYHTRMTRRSRESKISRTSAVEKFHKMQSIKLFYSVSESSFTWTVESTLLCNGLISEQKLKFKFCRN